MNADVLHLGPGTELLLETATGVVLGEAAIERVSESGSVVARPKSHEVHPRPAELQLIADLAESVDCLALAAMEELEVQLAMLGFRLNIPGQDVILDLRKEFLGIVIAEQMTRIAFRLVVSWLLVPSPTSGDPC